MLCNKLFSLLPHFVQCSRQNHTLGVLKRPLVVIKNNYRQKVIFVQNEKVTEKDLIIQPSSHATETYKSCSTDWPRQLFLLENKVYITMRPDLFKLLRIFKFFGFIPFQVTQEGLSFSVGSCQFFYFLFIFLYGVLHSGFITFRFWTSWVRVS